MRRQGSRIVPLNGAPPLPLFGHPLLHLMEERDGERRLSLILERLRHLSPNGSSAAFGGGGATGC